MSNKLKLIGEKFSRLLVIGELPMIKKHSVWLCKCDCGKEVSVSGSALRTGNTKSCGCYNSEVVTNRNTTHGLINSGRIYYIWQRMKQRCRDSNCEDYKDYGGRGISICSEWLDFTSFHTWAHENGYAPDLTLDRKDNNGNYEPGNCKWSTIKEQARNKRSNHKIYYNGKLLCLSEISEITGIESSLLRYRLKSNFSQDRLFTPPKLKQKS